MNHVNDSNLAVFTKESRNMSTSLALINAQLPAHLQATGAKLLEESRKAAAGIKAGGFPSVSIKGSKFHIKKDGETKTIMNPDEPDLPLMKLKCVVVSWSPFVSKTFYAGDYVAGDDREPDCRSDDGKNPDADLETPQNLSCHDCPQNEWGSKISKQSGKDVKACSDNKRLVILPLQALESEALSLQVTPAALKDWKQFVDLLSSKSIPIQSVITELTFDPQASFPKLKFGFGGFLDEAQFAKVSERMEGDDVKLIANPRNVSSVRKTIPILPAPAAEAPQLPLPKPLEPQKPVPEQPAPIVPQKPAEDARLAHVPDPMKTLIANLGGPDSPAGAAVLAQYPAPAPVVAVVDPFVNVPDAMKTTITGAVTAVGGPDSVGGKAILAAFPAPGAATQEAAKKTRAKKAETPAPVAPVVPNPQPAPTPAASLTTAPVANVASALAGDLDALLRNAMSVKAPGG